MNHTTYRRFKKVNNTHSLNLNSFMDLEGSAGPELRSELYEE